MRITDVDAVTPEVADAFQRDGYLVVERLIADDELDRIRQAYDDIVSGRTRARGDRLLGDIIRQVKDPSVDHPRFAANGAIDAGTLLATRLFGRDDLVKVYEMLIDKPPGTEHETPWHQDVGYWGRPVAPAGSPTGVADAQIWLALDPVDVDNGCMQFIPRPHRSPSFAHRVVSGDPDSEGRLIAIDEPIDTAAAVACPLQPGGCTVHLTGTPHFTGPNLTDRPRRAYIFNIGPAALAAGAEAAMVATWGTSTTTAGDQR